VPVPSNEGIELVVDIYYDEKKIKTMMVNTSTYLKKTNNYTRMYLSPQIIEHKKTSA
jgi:hypothetical protein